MKHSETLTIEIAGGLGNQLFMLSAGIYLKEKYHREIRFDIGDLIRIAALHPGHNVWTLGLISNFQIEVGIQDNGKNRVRKLFCDYKNKLIVRTLGFVPWGSVFRIPEIGYFDFDQLPPQIKRISGYFQTWKYFSEIEAKPNPRDFDLGNHSEWYLTQLERLQKQPVAALHIRRGDYTLAINRTNGILSWDYYNSVISKIPQELEIWIFTDSPTTIIDELSLSPVIGRSIFVLQPPQDSDPSESMLLMSMASHIGISNSTFSWWAAALADTDTHIYAPSKWFENRDDPAELLPENWIRVESEWVSQ